MKINKTIKKINILLKDLYKKTQSKENLQFYSTEIYNLIRHFNKKKKFIQKFDNRCKIITFNNLC